MKRKLSATSQQCVTALKTHLKQGPPGINARLLSLKNAGRCATAEPKNGIAKTQRMMEESVRSIARFARELGTLHRARLIGPELCGGVGVNFARVRALLM